MKADAALFPFGQLPVMEDEGVLVSQSNAMLRHLGRKHALAGAGLAQQAAVDVLLDGAEAIKVSSATSLIDRLKQKIPNPPNNNLAEQPTNHSLTNY